MKWITFLCLLVLTVSCSPHAEKAKTGKPQEKLITRDEAIGGIPCFKCHSYQRFAAGAKGSFPHFQHLDKGYHCNQCHTIRGHRAMKTNVSFCQGCHGIKTFTFASSGFASRFNHESHAKAGCRECHPGLFQMKKDSSRMTMSALYQGRYCGACHNGKKAFSSRDCARCHDMKSFGKTLQYKVSGVGDVVFSHEFHTQAFNCDDCHPGLFEMKKTQKKMTMEAMYGGKLCGACHNGEKASPSTDCAKCHKQ